jgi:hypothetical protein
MPAKREVSMRQLRHLLIQPTFACCRSRSAEKKCTDHGWKLRLGAGGRSANQRRQTHFALADILDCDFRRLLRPRIFVSSSLLAATIIQKAVLS